MATRQLLGIVLVATLLMLFALPGPAATLNSTIALYRSRCAACHGVSGDSNTPMARKQNIPAFTSAAVRNLSSADLEEFILFGGKERLASHTYFYKGITKDDATKLVVYIKELGSSTISSR